MNLSSCCQAPALVVGIPGYQVYVCEKCGKACDLSPPIGIEEAKMILREKMLRERPTLRQYLKQRMDGEARSSREWNAAHPDCSMAHWGSGAAYAYFDVLNKIEQDEFAPEDMP